MKTLTCKGLTIKPNKVVCVGRNYVEHIEELGNELPDEMVLFFKPNVCISKELLANQDENFHYEGEISFVVQNKQLVAVGFGLDLTKRKLQSRLKTKQLPWERAKSFNASAVFSEFVSFKNLNNLSLELYKNSELVQKGGIKHMIYKPLTMIQEVESFISLEDDDILMTGTPKGVGTFKKDDIFVGKIYENEKLLVECEWIAK